MVESIEKYWTGPNTYDPAEFERSRYLRGLPFWLPHMLRSGEIEAGQRVLEIGCGTGGLVIAMAKEIGVQACGLELSKDLLQFANQKEDGDYASWVRGNGEELPFVDGFFDRVMMSLVLHQISDRTKAIGEICRVLRLGGKFLIRTVLPEEVGNWIPGRYFPKVMEIEQNRMPTWDDMVKMIESAGFADFHTETVSKAQTFSLEKLIDGMRSRWRPSYHILSDDEMEEGIEQMREDFGDQDAMVVSRHYLHLVAQK